MANFSDVGTVTATLGRIECQKVDVIVNSAHRSLFRGSGVCGAIHGAAGIELEAHCKSLGPCEVGEFVVTPAFQLPAKWIIHTVMPKLAVGEKMDQQALFDLERQFRSIFAKAYTLGARSIAIPPLGIGGHRLPIVSTLEALASSAYAADRILGLDVHFVSTEPTYVELFSSLSQF